MRKLLAVLFGGSGRAAALIGTNLRLQLQGQFGFLKGLPIKPERIPAIAGLNVFVPEYMLIID
jgi:hypothetical protein